MSIQKRLDKIEGIIKEKSKEETPLLITIYKDDNVEKILESMKAKYGEDYQPRIILKSPKTRQEGIKYCLL